ncbi:ribonucleotide reductase [Pelagophyceae sp. CCMP2097]|nr:ribonucleotide reductase [Pelagophyceae sp. CCMP2097]
MRFSAAALLCAAADATKWARRTVGVRGGADGAFADAVGAARARAVLHVSKLCGGLDLRFVSPEAIVDKALSGARDASVDSEIEPLLAESAAYMATDHPDYGKLAGRIEVARLHSHTSKSFVETMVHIHNEPDVATGASTELLDAGLIAKFQDEEWCRTIESALVQDRDYDYDYFGIKTLMRSYLLKDRATGLCVERPQHLLMRVALGVHRGWESDQGLARALESYDLMSKKYFIHASPTLFHAGTKKPHLSSCFLLGAVDDSIEGIYSTLGRCAAISKAAGGIGFSVSDVRASASRIRGTGGASNGLVPMLRVYDATARYVDQGGGKRPGAFAAYIEPWHADILDVLDLKKNHGKEERRARDLFYGLWIPDLFMRRVEAGGTWSLLCPDECRGLTSCHGEEFDTLYEKYEKEGKARKVVDARRLWRAIMDAQIETGTPYMLYKDACNLKSNHNHLGTIKCSNLCCEIVEFSDANETAVCNLASVVLPTFIKRAAVEPFEPFFDFAALKRVVKVVARNLDATIDHGAYPCVEAERSNKRHRPVGIGVQGLADALLELRAPFDSDAGAELNRKIFETIYLGALEASAELARDCGPYDSYAGSLAEKGVLQPDLWGVSTPDHADAHTAHSEKCEWDWTALRAMISKHGLRNSLLVAPMPTASTAQIVGFNECIEPYTSNLYSRRVKAGEFVVANAHLVRDLANLGLWDAEMRNDLVRHSGSVQQLDRVPHELRQLYKTAWELSQKTLLDLSAVRGAFVDQSQSHNAFIAKPTYDKLTSFHFHGWRLGLKTGMYYLRTKPAVRPVQVTLDPSAPQQPQQTAPEAPDVCISCSG